MEKPMRKKVIMVLLAIVMLMALTKIVKAYPYEYEHRPELIQNNQINIVGIGFRVSFIDLGFIPQKVCFRLFSSGYNHNGKPSEYGVCK